MSRWMTPGRIASPRAIRTNASRTAGAPPPAPSDRGSPAPTGEGRPSRFPFLGAELSEQRVDPLQSLGEVRGRVAHPDPDVAVHPEVVAGHDEGGFLFEEAPRKVRGVDPERVPQETDGARGWWNVREEGPVVPDPVGKDRIVPLEDRARSGQDLLAARMREGDLREPIGQIGRREGRVVVVAPERCDRLRRPDNPSDP